MRDNESELVIVSGGALQAIGASIASIGQTVKLSENNKVHSKKLGTLFVIIGNGVEALGNAMQAAGHQNILEKDDGTDWIVLGGWLQFAGNSANASAGILELSTEDLAAVRLDLLGDVIQSMGAAFESVGFSLSQSPYASVIAAAEMLQSVGAAIEGTGALTILRGSRVQGERIQAIGSYLLAAGAIISSKGFFLEFNSATPEMPIHSYQKYNNINSHRRRH